MDISLLYDRYRAGTLDPNLYQKLLSVKQEIDKHRSTIQAIRERSVREKWGGGGIRLSQEVGKIFQPHLDRYLSELTNAFGGQSGWAGAVLMKWLRDAAGVEPTFSGKYQNWSDSFTYGTYRNVGEKNYNKLIEMASLSVPQVAQSNIQSQQQIADLQKQLAQMQAELQKTRSAPQPEATIQPSQPQQVGDNWELPEEGLLQTGEFTTQLAKQRQQQDANLMASGLTRQQILQQRGSENIVRELGLSKMIAEQRRKSIQDWLQTVGGLQQQVRPPDFTGLREMASAFQQGTSTQQQMMMKLFENLIRQGGS